MKKRIAAAVFCTALAFASLTSCQRVAEEPSESGANTYIDPVSGNADFVSPIYSSLTENEKTVYDKIVTAVSEFRDTVSFDPPIPRETARKIYKLVYSQERKYFWLSNLFYAPESEISVLRLF
nr:hypothetical protein [Oscillospiraceae bacterium]